MKAIYDPIIFHSQILRNSLYFLFAIHALFKRALLMNRKSNLSLKARDIRILRNEKCLWTLHLKYPFFWHVTQHRLIFSGKPIGPIVKGQAFQDRSVTVLL